VRSLKTDNLATAEHRALKLWTEHLQGKHAESSGPNFTQLSILFTDQYVCSPNSLPRVLHIIKMLTDSFGSTPAHAITQQNFYSFLQTRPGPLSLAYIKRLRTMLLQILRFGIATKKLNTLPIIPVEPPANLQIQVVERAKSKGCSKEWFSRFNGLFYHHFTKPEALAKQRPVKQFATLRLEAIYRFCFHSFTRLTTEVTSLRWKDISPKINADGLPYYFITIPDSKNSKRRIVSRTTVLPYEAVQHLHDWRDYAQSIGIYQPDFFVFPNIYTSTQRRAGLPPTRVQMGTVARQFWNILNQMNGMKTKTYPDAMMMSHNDDGRITLSTGCRSTAITHALLDGVSIEKIAYLAGSSVGVLWNNYRAAINEASSVRFSSAQSHRPKHQRYPVRPKFPNEDPTKKSAKQFSPTQELPDEEPTKSFAKEFSPTQDLPHEEPTKSFAKEFSPLDEKRHAHPVSRAKEKVMVAEVVEDDWLDEYFFAGMGLTP